MTDPTRARSPVERILEDKGPPKQERPQLSRREMQRERSVESVLRANAPPRWMERAAAVDRGIKREEAKLASAYETLRADVTAAQGATAPDPGTAFAERWTAVVREWRFDERLNTLIEQHNEWYPIERDLPFDLRTRDYVLVNGSTHRRPVLGPAWALERFPPRL